MIKNSSEGGEEAEAGAVLPRARCRIEDGAGHSDTAMEGEQSSRGHPLSTGLCPVPKRYLLGMAGLAWCVAGINVLYIGLISSVNGWHIRQILIAAMVFVVFMMIFTRIVRKNGQRIMAFQEERVSLFRFLDVKGYVVMILMMSLGIGLRYAGMVPLSWIQVFYTGLGAALIVSGFLFLIKFFQNVNLRT